MKSGPARSSIRVHKAVSLEFFAKQRMTEGRIACAGLILWVAALVLLTGGDRAAQVKSQARRASRAAAQEL